MKRSKARQRAIILALTIVTGMILAGGGTAAADEAGPRIDLPVPLRMPFEPLRATTPEDPRDKAPCFVGVKPALGPGTSAPGYGELDILAAACCQPSTAGSEHLPDKPGFHTAIQYSRMEMGTILSGTGRISPDDVIRQKLAAGATSYSVPTHMTMERWTLQLGYRLDDHQSILATVPSITNNMDMRSGRRMGMTTMFMNMRMNTVSALGDISALYLRDGFRDDWRRFVWGFGLQAPTGNSQVRNSSNASFT